MLQDLEAAPPKDLMIFLEISSEIFLEEEILSVADKGQIKALIFSTQ